MAREPAGHSVRLVGVVLDEREDVVPAAGVQPGAVHGREIWIFH